MKYTVVVVDDHVLIAKALGSIISSFKDFEVLYECENGMELQEKLKDANNHPTIVLLDVSMPIMNGFETAKWLTDNHPKIAIIALSMQNDDSSVITMLKNGAKGYLLKNTYPSELEKALLAVIENGFHYPDWASITTHNTIETSQKTKEEARKQFTKRELELLAYIGTDLSYKEIADKMNCSTRTIENYKDVISQKLNIKTRVGLAVFAHKNDIV